MTPEYRYDIESDEEPLGLLSSFKEIDECMKEPTPTKPDLRSHRNMSTDIASAVSDLVSLFSILGQSLLSETPYALLKHNKFIIVESSEPSRTKSFLF